MVETTPKKNLRAMVDIRHFPDGRPMYATRPVVIRKGRVVAHDAIVEKDAQHMLRNGHVEETDDALVDDAALDKILAEEAAKAAADGAPGVEASSLSPVVKDQQVEPHVLAEGQA